MSEVQYKDSELGRIPKDWKISTLEKHIRRVNRKNISGNQNVLTISADLGLVNQKKYFKKFVASTDRSNYYHLFHGEFAYNKSSSIGYPVGVVRKLKKYEQGVLSPLYICFSIYSDEFDDVFAEKFFDHNLFFKEVAKIAQEGARTHGLLNIGISDFMSVRILLPPLPEQKKIASILTSVDEVLEKTEAQIEKLQDLKTAMMNELLTKGIGHTEFKDSELGKIPKSWEVSKVGDVIRKIDSGWSPECFTEPAYGENWGVLKTTAVTWQGFNVAENKALPASKEGRPQITLSEGDVLITRAGPIDRVGVVAYCGKAYPRMMLSDKIIRIQVIFSILEGEFFSLWLSSASAQGELKSKISGMAEAQSNISQEILKSIKIPIIYREEQQKIASILSSINTNIEEKQKKLEHTQSLKKSLMQDLLTGKVRVQVN